MFLDWSRLQGTYLETSAAVVAALQEVAPSRRVRTQGHVLAADDLARTLAVEATIHHLDLVECLAEGGPTAAGLAEVRRTLDGLTGAPLAAGWSDARYARVATGRAGATAEELAELGDVAERLPLFS
jgi:hypothetical protein